MKYGQKNLIRFVSLLIASMLVMMSIACAGTLTTGGSSSYRGDSDLADRLRKVPDFNFWYGSLGRTLNVEEKSL